MADALVISIDGMGGDHAPESVLEGVDIAARRRPDLRFAIHGDQGRLASLLDQRADAKRASRIVPAERAVPMDAKPSQALRQRHGSSMWNAVIDVEEGRAHACVSAGNTGAYMAMGMFRLRTMEGVHRPALAARWPTASGGHVVVLDVGANVTADSEQLVEFAIMGEAFQRVMSGKSRPVVGLLNVGAEDQKGHEEIRAAAKLIRDSGVDMDFFGNVEGGDIAKGGVDVVVTDGFTGNIALKTAEGTARLVGGFLRDELSRDLLSKLAALLAYPAIQRFKARMDPGSFNGAVLLGVNGVVVKSHGSADGPSFAAAIDVAASMAASHYRDEIMQNLARLRATIKAPVPAPAETNTP